MNAIALALVLFAAVLHASWNFVSKKSGGGSSFVLLYETFAFLIYMPLLYLVDFKRLLSLPLELWLLIILSAVLHVIYTLVLQTGYRKADYSVVYPTARGTGPAFTVLVAVFLFGEKLAPLGFAGIACVLLGIVLLAMPGKDKQLIIQRIVLGCVDGRVYCFVFELGRICDSADRIDAFNVLRPRHGGSALSSRPWDSFQGIGA